MELEGLKRGLAAIENDGVYPDYLVTDRHRSVQKYMREQKPAIKHKYDVWHTARSKIDLKAEL